MSEEAGDGIKPRCAFTVLDTSAVSEAELQGKTRVSETGPRMAYGWSRPQLSSVTLPDWGHPLICCCSVAQSCLTPCDPMDCSTPGFPVLHCLPEFAQTHVHCVDGIIQPSTPPCYSLELCIQTAVTFLFSFAFCLYPPYTVVTQ